MTSLYCFLCAHYGKQFTCAAYPDRIPDDIFTGRRKHDSVQPDQVGNSVRQVKQELARHFLKGR